MPFVGVAEGVVANAVAAAAVAGEIANDDDSCSPTTKLCAKGCTTASCAVDNDDAKEGVNLDSSSESDLFIVSSDVISLASGR